MLFYNLLYILLSSNVLYGEVNVVPSVLEEASKNKMIDYLIQLEPHPSIASGTTSGLDATKFLNDIKAHSLQSQASLIEILKKYGKNVTYVQTYFFTNTVAVTSNKMVLETLMKSKDIKEISSNKKFEVKPSSLNNHDAVNGGIVDWEEDNEPLWSIRDIHADKISPEIRRNARKLVYANADTGIEYRHPAILENYLGYRNGRYNHNYAWWDGNKRSNRFLESKCGIDTQRPCADDDHGTHTMSTVVGGFGLGISPTTKWMACKNMNMNLGSPESYLGCLQFFLAPTNLRGEDPRPELRPHVVGNSYTCPPKEGCSETTFTYALRALKSAGILMSVSAGNNGLEGCGSIQFPPAIDPNSFTVGATNYKSNRRAYFSSMGPVPGRIDSIGLDVVAPGVNITGAALGGKYRSLDGTSMASPHVSGAALLIMAACPHLERQVDMIEDLLRETATPIYATKGCGDDDDFSYPNNEYGYGKINVGKAIALCQRS